MKPGLMGLLGLALLVGCARPEVWDTEVKHLPSRGWHADSTLRFQWEVADTTASVEVIITLRHDASYPYQNLYLFRSLHSVRGQELADTAEYPLADATGAWLGTGVGELKSRDFVLRNQAVRFKKPGKYTLELTQGMRDTVLPGIKDVVVTIQKVENQGNESK
jgi:gliding motility-associated lipoprotein GldH